MRQKMRNTPDRMCQAPLLMVRRQAVAVAVALGVLAACDAQGPEPQARPTVAPQPTPESPTPAARVRLVFLDHSTLKSYDLSTGDTEKIGALPSADVELSPDGSRIAVVTEAGQPGPEGFGDPRLTVAPVEDPGELTELGPGRAPLWSPDGATIAALVEAEGHVICPGDVGAEDPGEAECRATERVRVYPAGGSADALPAIGPGTWTILGWTAGDRILAASNHNEVVALGFPGATFDEVQDLAFTPPQVWGISPVEPTLLIVRDRAVFLSTANDDGEPGDGIEVDTGGAAPGDGAWSPDGTRIALTLVGKRGRGPLALIDAHSGAVDTVPESAPAHGNVVWAADSSAFAYVGIDPKNRLRLRAVLCTRTLQCRPLFSWAEGVTLLGFSG